MPNIEEVVVIIIISLIIFIAAYKIYKDKKNGIKCSGCPHSKTCNKKEHH